MPNIIRIRDLAYETDASNAYIPVDKSSYGISAKRISISDIANYLGVLCGVTFDIMTGELVVETNYGYYITDLDGRYAIIMDDLADVNATYPSENDVLVYKSSFWTTTSNFISGLTFDIGTGILTLMTQIGDFAYDLDGRYASELNELIDVNAPSPSDNDVLVYSGGIWINSAATFSGGGTSGSSGTSGDDGTSGSSGTSGVDGSGTSGSSGTSGLDGSSVLPITYDKLGDDLKGRMILDYAEVDWSISSIWTKTLTGNTTLSFSNLQENKQISLIISGDFSLTLPGTTKIINGFYDGTVINFIQLYCSNSGTSEVWVSINQEIV